RFIGGAERGKHQRQPLLLLLGAGLFLRAIEVVERERYVLRQASKQLYQIRREGAFVGGKKQQNADSPAAVLQQRKTCAGPGAVFPCEVMPMRGTRIAEIVVHDAGLARPERDAGQAPALRVLGG